MDELEITNPVPVDEAAGWVRALLVTLLAPAHDDDFERRLTRWSRDWRPERTWGVREQGAWVATLATEPRTLTVPAGAVGTRDLEVDALTAVTVAATHRRRGLLRRMITQSLDAAKQRGDALSILIAAEWPIYGRYGYGPATVSSGYRLRLRRPQAVLPPPVGTLRTVTPAELPPLAAELFDVARRQRPGQVDRRPPWWDRRLGQDGYQVLGPRPTWIVHEGAGGIDGMLGWRVTRDFGLTDVLGAVAVVDLIASTDDAYRDLFAYLCSLDVVEEVELPDRPVDEPIRWLMHDGRALQPTESHDFLWVRILDVPAALSARGYAGPGRVVLDVVDPSLGGYASGRFALDTDADPACVPTDEPADLRIDQRALASIYLGGHRLRPMAATGRVEERTEGALDLVDAMFAVSLAPWNQTGF